MYALNNLRNNMQNDKRNIKNTLSYKWLTEVWNNLDGGAIDRMMIDDSIARGIESTGIPDNRHAKGAEGFKLFFNGFCSMYSEIHIEIEDVICERDLEAARLIVNAVHRESGSPVKFSGICMIRKEDGRIAEAWNNFDFLTMYQQIGMKLV
mgnify:CR=1 FL=1